MPTEPAEEERQNKYIVYSGRCSNTHHAMHRFLSPEAEGLSLPKDSGTVRTKTVMWNGIPLQPTHRCQTTVVSQTYHVSQRKQTYLLGSFLLGLLHRSYFALRFCSVRFDFAAFSSASSSCCMQVFRALCVASSMPSRTPLVNSPFFISCR